MVKKFRRSMSMSKSRNTNPSSARTLGTGFESFVSIRGCPGSLSQVETCHLPGSGYSAPLDVRPQHHRPDLCASAARAPVYPKERRSPVRRSEAGGLAAFANQPSSGGSGEYGASRGYGGPGKSPLLEKQLHKNFAA